MNRPSSTPSRNRLGSLFPAVVLIAAVFILVGAAQLPRPHISSVQDWTHHHLIYSQPSTWVSAWKAQQDPRYWQQKIRRGEMNDDRVKQLSSRDALTTANHRFARIHRLSRNRRVPPRRPLRRRSSQPRLGPQPLPPPRPHPSGLAPAPARNPNGARLGHVPRRRRLHRRTRRHAHNVVPGLSREIQLRHHRHARLHQRLRRIPHQSRRREERPGQHHRLQQTLFGHDR